MEDIARNNFDFVWQQNGRIDKVKIGLEFEIPPGDVEQIHVADGVDVWLYKHGPLDMYRRFEERVFHGSSMCYYREEKRWYR